MGPVPDSHRFLIRPSVRVHGLASLALRLAAERVADDWRAPTGSAPSPPARRWVRTMPGRVTGRRAGRPQGARRHADAEPDIAAPGDAADRRPPPVTVVAAIGENPPGNVVRKGEVPHWTLLSSGGGDGMRTAETALRRYGPRRRIGEYLRALRTGIRDRRPDAAGDLRGCLAFDAMTAVRDLQLPARESPDSPAERPVSPESGGAVAIHAAYGRVIGQRAPPEPDRTVARHLTPVAGLAGFRPTKRRPLPGTRKPWQGLRIPNVAETHARAIRARTERRRE